MALRLEIISDQRKELGDRAQKVFSAEGGAIGRASDNAWQLPDPHRYLSGHHIRIRVKDGQYVLEDTSTNGVFVNGSQAALGKRKSHVLKQGDTLRLGEYLIRAHIEHVEVKANLSGSLVAVDRVIPLSNPLQPAPGSDPDDLDSSLQLESLFTGDASGLVALPIGFDDLLPEEKPARGRAGTRARMDVNAPPPLFDLRSGLQTLCRGAGVEVNRLPLEADTRMLLLAGQLLRETVLGLQDIVRVQRAFQQQNQIDLPAPDVDGPAPDSAAANEFLLHLLVGHENHEFDAVLLLRTYFAGARRHDAALRCALPEAVQAFLSHLDPDSISSRAAARGSESGSWDMYGEIFRTLTQSPDGQLPHLFAESLAQGYLKSRNDPDTDD
jgi:predicted component of type VI protein secretion system